jgi:hypothetical protein
MLQYLPTILVGLAVLGVIALVIARLIYNKRHGKRSCSCGGACSACPFSCGGEEKQS